MSPAPDRDSTSPEPELTEILARCVALQVSDVHLAAGEPVRCRLEGRLQSLSLAADAPPALTAEYLEKVVDGLLSEPQRATLAARGSVDGALTSNVDARWRFNAYRRGGRLGLALRRLENRFRSLSELGLSEDLHRVGEFGHGLVVVAGPTGSGKSTTLATLIHRINQTRQGHIITLEDPVEYLHASLNCLVTQRQIGIDSPGFHQALVDSLRQDPDVILVGEVRDLDTIRTAITAAETGHLVFASVHAGDCVGAIDRLVSVFPADEQKMIQRLLALVLRTVIAQHLLVRHRPAAAGGEPAEFPELRSAAEGAEPPGPQAERGRSSSRVLASEILVANSAVSNLIAQGNTKQIYSMLETGAAEGMQTLDASLARLYRQRLISDQAAQSLARNPLWVVDRKRPLPAFR
jgi:twitching motility protein PilT